MVFHGSMRTWGDIRIDLLSQASWGTSPIMAPWRRWWANDRLQMEWKVIKSQHWETSSFFSFLNSETGSISCITVACFHRWVHWLSLESGGVAKWGLRNFLQDWDWGSFWIILPQRDKVDPEGCAKWGAFFVVSLAGETNDWGSKHGNHAAWSTRYIPLQDRNTKVEPRKKVVCTI